MLHVNVAVLLLVCLLCLTCNGSYKYFLFKRNEVYMALSCAVNKYMLISPDLVEDGLLHYM